MDKYEFTWSERIGSVSFTDAASAVQYFAQRVADPQTGFVTTLAALLDGPSRRQLDELEAQLGQ